MRSGFGRVVTGADARVPRPDPVAAGQCAAPFYDFLGRIGGHVDAARVDTPIVGLQPLRVELVFLLQVWRGGDLCMGGLRHPHSTAR